MDQNHPFSHENVALLKNMGVEIKQTQSVKKTHYKDVLNAAKERKAKLLEQQAAEIENNDRKEYINLMKRSVAYFLESFYGDIITKSHKSIIESSPEFGMFAPNEEETKSILKYGFEQNYNALLGLKTNKIEEENAEYRKKIRRYEKKITDYESIIKALNDRIEALETSNKNDIITNFIAQEDVEKLKKLTSRMGKGAPKKEIDLVELQDYVSKGFSNRKIANIFAVSESLIRNRIKQNNIVDTRKNATRKEA